ncbi:MAG TPA: hypothetical protein VK749_22735 [Xanthobacteraceae bacterium]|nr:hypothetical protein [Xanthobacteraceae bacterium]
MTTIARTWMALLLTSLAIAGCSKTPKPDAAADPTVLPTEYRSQIATYLAQLLSDRADFRSSLIGAPVLEQVGAGQHYIVCVMLNGHNQHKEKVVIYLGPNINQFVDATPGQCVNAAYQPFKELAALLPPT